MIELTVGLPMFRSSTIAHLAFESLCNQEGVDFGWELLIIEEVEDCFGEEKIKEYLPRLEAVGCKRVVYKSLEQWVPLSFKWKFLGESSADSKCFLLQAADCYSQPYRLKETYDLFNDDPSVDWVQSPLGCFYHIQTGQMVRFNQDLYQHKCALNMAIRTELIRQLPSEQVPAGVDSWLFRTCTALKGSELEVKNNDSGNWRRGVDIHGLNKISLDRGQMILDVVPPFEHSDEELDDLVPDQVADFIRSKKESAKDNKTIWHKYY